MSKKYITTIQEYGDTEELFIEIPDELIQELGWEEGTELKWETSQGDIKISSTESRQQSQETNISSATEEDYQDFWYNSKSEETFAQNFFNE